ncbi:Variant sh3 domain containing protein [Entamoeba marina]
MSFQTNLMGNLEFVFKHASHNIKFSTEMAEFFDKIRSHRKEYYKTINKTCQDFTKKLEDQSCYGTVKTTLEQLLKSLQLEAEGQMKVAETLSEAIEEFKAQIKDVEKGSKALKQDADLRLKEKGETDGVVEKKMKTLEDKRDHYKEKEDDQCKVYTTSVETTNKRIKHFFDIDQIEILGLQERFEKSYLESVEQLIGAYSESISTLPDTQKQSIDEFNEKAKTLSPNDDVVTFCEENDTARRTPSYLPVVDASALGLRRADDPKGLERVYLTCQTTHDFTGETPEELDIKKHQSGWWYATFKETGKGGFVPETYVKDLN